MWIGFCRVRAMPRRILVNLNDFFYMYVLADVNLDIKLDELFVHLKREIALEAHDELIFICQFNQLEFDSETRLVINTYAPDDLSADYKAAMQEIAIDLECDFIMRHLEYFLSRYEINAKAFVLPIQGITSPFSDKLYALHAPDKPPPEASDVCSETHIYANAIFLNSSPIVRPGSALISGETVVTEVAPQGFPCPRGLKRLVECGILPSEHSSPKSNDTLLFVDLDDTVYAAAYHQLDICGRHQELDFGGKVINACAKLLQADICGSAVLSLERRRALNTKLTHAITLLDTSYFGDLKSRLALAQSGHVPITEKFFYDCFYRLAIDMWRKKFPVPASSADEAKFFLQYTDYQILVRLQNYICNIIPSLTGHYKVKGYSIESYQGAAQVIQFKLLYEVARRGLFSADVNDRMVALLRQVIGVRFNLHMLRLLSSFNSAQRFLLTARDNDDGKPGESTTAHIRKYALLEGKDEITLQQLLANKIFLATASTKACASHPPLKLVFIACALAVIGGGEAILVDDNPLEVHPEICRLCNEALKALGIEATIHTLHTSTGGTLAVDEHFDCGVDHKDYICADCHPQKIIEQVLAIYNSSSGKPSAASDAAGAGAGAGAGGVAEVAAALDIDRLWRAWQRYLDKVKYTSVGPLPSTADALARYGIAATTKDPTPGPEDVTLAPTALAETLRGTL